MHNVYLWYTVAYVSAPFCKKLCAFFGEKEGDWKGIGREWEGKGKAFR